MATVQMSALYQLDYRRDILRASYVPWRQELAACTTPEAVIKTVFQLFAAEAVSHSDQRQVLLEVVAFAACQAEESTIAFLTQPFLLDQLIELVQPGGEPAKFRVVVAAFQALYNIIRTVARRGPVTSATTCRLAPWVDGANKPAYLWFVMAQAALVTSKLAASSWTSNEDILNLVAGSCALSNMIMSNPTIFGVDVIEKQAAAFTTDHITAINRLVKVPAIEPSVLKMLSAFTYGSTSAHQLIAENFEFEMLSKTIRGLRPKLDQPSGHNVQFDDDGDHDGRDDDNDSDDDGDTKGLYGTKSNRAPDRSWPSQGSTRVKTSDFEFPQIIFQKQKSMNTEKTTAVDKRALRAVLLLTRHMAFVHPQPNDGNSSDTLDIMDQWSLGGVASNLRSTLPSCGRSTLGSLQSRVLDLDIIEMVLMYIIDLTKASTQITLIDSELVRILDAFKLLQNVAYTKQGAQRIHKVPDATTSITLVISMVSSLVSTMPMAVDVLVSGVTVLNNMACHLDEVCAPMAQDRFFDVLLAFFVTYKHILNPSQQLQMSISLGMATRLPPWDKDDTRVSRVLSCIDDVATYLASKKIIAGETSSHDTSGVGRAFAHVLGNVRLLVRYIARSWIQGCVLVLRLLSPNVIIESDQVRDVVRKAQEVFPDLCAPLHMALVDQIYYEDELGLRPIDSPLSSAHLSSGSEEEGPPPEIELTLQLCHAGLHATYARAIARGPLSRDGLVIPPADLAARHVSDFIRSKEETEHVSIVNTLFAEQVINRRAMKDLLDAPTAVVEKLGTAELFALQGQDRFNHWMMPQETFGASLGRTWHQTEVAGLDNINKTIRVYSANYRHDDAANPFMSTSFDNPIWSLIDGVPPHGFLYHATNSASARSIMIGIDVNEGKTHRDFSVTGAFYLNPSLVDAVAWAHAIAPHTGVVIVFRKPDLSDTTIFPDTTTLRIFTAPTSLQDELEEWGHRDAWRQFASMCTDRNTPAVQRAIPDDLRPLQLIVGPQTKINHSKWFYKPQDIRARFTTAGDACMQWCIRTDALAERFDAFLLGVVAFKLRNT